MRPQVPWGLMGIMVVLVVVVVAVMTGMQSCPQKNLQRITTTMVDGKYVPVDELPEYVPVKESSPPSESSRSSRSGGLFSGGVPKSQGQHIDIGYGWDNNLGVGWQPNRGYIFAIGGNINGVDAKKIDPYCVKTDSTTIRYAYRFSPTELQTGGLTGLAVSQIKIYVLKEDRRDSSKYSQQYQEVPSSDKSDYGKGYALLEFQLPSSPSRLYAVEGMGEFMILKR